MTDTNSRFRAGEVAAELRAINARLDQIVESQKGIQTWQLNVVARMATTDERIDTLRHEFSHSNKLVGAISAIIAAVFSTIAGIWAGSR